MLEREWLRPVDADLYGSIPDDRRPSGHLLTSGTLRQNTWWCQVQVQQAQPPYLARSGKRRDTRPLIYPRTG